MSFQAFLFLLTGAALIVGWIMHEVFDRTDDGPGYWQTILFPGRYPPPRYRWTFITVFLTIGAIGAWYLP